MRLIVSHGQASKLLTAGRPHPPAHEQVQGGRPRLTPSRPTNSRETALDCRGPASKCFRAGRLACGLPTTFPRTGLGPAATYAHAPGLAHSPTVSRGHRLTSPFCQTGTTLGWTCSSNPSVS